MCRLCRGYGEKLFLKGQKCTTSKCPVLRREYAPGQHGKTKRRKISDYGLQLREKQKAKHIYGVLEKQFRNYFKLATKSPGKTGEALLQFLERRLDNVIYKLCFTYSRPQARQLVRHNRVYVNNGKVNIPSYIVKAGDMIEVKGKDVLLKRTTEIRKNLKTKERDVPKWLEADEGSLKAKIKNLPQRDDIDFSINEQLIVELYSK
jgi:small subunit ribosomal protein S4